MLEYSQKLPSPTDLKDIIKAEGSNNSCNIIRAIVEVKIKSVKRKRIDITLSENVIKEIDSVSRNRSKFIEDASMYYIHEYLRKS